MGKNPCNDQLLMEAVRSARAEGIEERKEKFNRLFYSQMETLKDRGCPQAILEVFQGKKDAVITKTIRANIDIDNIPFLPVIPKSYLGIYGLMPMVRNGKNIGLTCLDPNQLTDVVDTSMTPLHH